MKSTLEFILPEEAYEHQVALQGADWKGVVEDTLSELRDRLKYRSEEFDAPTLKTLANIQQEIYTIVEERGLLL